MKRFERPRDDMHQFIHDKVWKTTRWRFWWQVFIKTASQSPDHDMHQVIHEEVWKTKRWCFWLQHFRNFHSNVIRLTGPWYAPDYSQGCWIDQEVMFLITTVPQLLTRILTMCTRLSMGKSGRPREADSECSSVVAKDSSCDTLWSKYKNKHCFCQARCFSHIILLCGSTHTHTHTHTHTQCSSHIHTHTM